MTLLILSLACVVWLEGPAVETSVSLQGLCSAASSLWNAGVDPWGLRDLEGLFSADGGGTRRGGGVIGGRAVIGGGGCGGVGVGVGGGPIWFFFFFSQFFGGLQL